VELTHHFWLDADLEQAWALVQDPAIATHHPLVKVRSVDGDAFTARCFLNADGRFLSYEGEGWIDERDHAAHRLVLSARGKAKGSTASATGTLTLTAAPGGGTDAELRTHLTVTGWPKHLPGVIRSIADADMATLAVNLNRVLRQAREDDPRVSG